MCRHVAVLEIDRVGSDMLGPIFGTKLVVKKVGILTIMNK